ncbi:MAG: hypothetical protein ACK41T_02595 [Pseudobdellovibrio sp.]
MKPKIIQFGDEIANDRAEAIFQRIVYAKNSERSNLNAKPNDPNLKKIMKMKKNLSLLC